MPFQKGSCWKDAFHLQRLFLQKSPFASRRMETTSGNATPENVVHGNNRNTAHSISQAAHQPSQLAETLPTASYWKSPYALSGKAPSKHPSFSYPTAMQDEPASHFSCAEPAPLKMPTKTFATTGSMHIPTTVSHKRGRYPVAQQLCNFTHSKAESSNTERAAKWQPFP